MDILERVSVMNRLHASLNDLDWKLILAACTHETLSALDPQDVQCAASHFAILLMVGEFMGFDRDEMLRHLAYVKNTRGNIHGHMAIIDLELFS